MSSGRFLYGAGTAKGYCQLVTEASFGVDPGSGYVEAELEGDPGGLENLKRVRLPDERLSPGDSVSTLGWPAAQYSVPPGTSLDLKSSLRGYTATIPTADAHITDHSTTCPIILLLKALFGGYSTGGVSAVATNTSSTEFIVTGGHGSKFKAGQAVWVEVVASSGNYEIGWIKTVSTDTITLRYPLSDNTDVGSKVVGAHTFFPGDRIDYSLTMQWWGWKKASETSPLYAEAYGLKGNTGTITLPPNGKAMLQMAALVARGYGATNAVELPVLATSTYPGPEGVAGGTFVLTTYAAPQTPIAVVPLDDQTISIDNKMSQMFSGGGTGGVSEQDAGVDGGRRMSFTLRKLLVDGTYRTAFEAPTAYTYRGSWGSQPGRAVAFCWPKFEIDDHKAPLSRNGDAIEELVGKPVNHGADSPATDDPANRPFYLAI